MNDVKYFIEDETRKTLQHFFPMASKDKPFEIRFIGTFAENDELAERAPIYAGLFTSVEDAITALKAFAPHPMGYSACYMLHNDIRADLKLDVYETRSFEHYSILDEDIDTVVSKIMDEPSEPNEPKQVTPHFVKVSKVTKDSDIVRVRNLFIDFDITTFAENSKESADMPSSDAERVEALKLVEECKALLKGCGFEDPTLACSGNGYHLMYALDLDVTDKGLVKDVLSIVDRQFTRDFGAFAVKIDVSVYNPARLTKLYGTKNCKRVTGYLVSDDPARNRPHRYSKVLDMPAERKITEKAVLRAFVDKYRIGKAEPSQASEPSEPSETTYGDTSVITHYAQDGSGQWTKARLIKDVLSNDRFLKLVEDWTEDENVTDKGAIKFVLKRCPFDSHSSDKKSALFLNPDGQVVFTCFTDGCAEHKGSRGFAEILDKIGILFKAQSPDKPKPFSGGYGQIDLLNSEIPATEWLVKGIIPSIGITTLISGPKNGKSTFMFGLATSVATGTTLQVTDDKTFETKQADVRYFACDQSPAENKDKIAEIQKSGMTLSQNAVFYSSVDPIPRLDADGLKALGAYLDEERNKNVRMLVFDTWADVKPDTGNGNAYERDAKMLKPIVDFAIKRKLAIVLLHHENKQFGSIKDTVDFNWLNASSGSVALGAKSVMFISFSRLGDSKIVVVKRKCRSMAQPKDYFLKWNENSGTFSYYGNVDDIVGDRQTMTKRIFEIIKSSMSAMDTGEIMDVLESLEIKIDGDVLRTLVNRLVRKRVLNKEKTRNNRILYSLNPSYTDSSVQTAPKSSIDDVKIEPKPVEVDKTHNDDLFNGMETDTDKKGNENG